MFKKRKDTPKISEYEKRALEKYDQLAEVAYSLRQKVADINVKNIALTIYPEGADLDLARIDLAEAKKSLMCKIGEYDMLRQEIIDILENHKDEVPQNFAHPIPSHWQVEHAIRTFVK